MNVLITGCSKGLGLAITAQMLIDGWTVYGLSRQLTPELENLQLAHPHKLHHLCFDLTNTSNIREKIFQNWITNDIPIHGFVNNAAHAYDDIITNINEYQLDRLFTVNVKSPFILTKYTIRNMLFNKVQGSIIHISSISVHTGYKGLSMYAASKASLEAFSKNCAREWGIRGIRSNCIVAGFMETDMSSTLTLEQKTRIYNRTSLKSPTSMASVAATAVFLLDGNKSKSITGQNLFVDSGTI